MCAHVKDLFVLLNAHDPRNRVVRVELSDASASPSTSPTAAAAAAAGKPRTDTNPCVPGSCGAGSQPREEDELEIVSDEGPAAGGDDRPVAQAAGPGTMPAPGAGCAMSSGDGAHGSSAASKQPSTPAVGPATGGKGAAEGRSSPHAAGSTGGPKPTTHLVGVRFPAALLPEVQAMLQSLVLRQVEGGVTTAAAMGRAGSSMGAGAGGTGEEGEGLEWVGGSCVRVEPVTPVDKRAMAKAYRAPKTMHDFFRPKTAEPAVEEGVRLTQAVGATQSVGVPAAGAMARRGPLGVAGVAGVKMPKGPALPATADFFKPRGAAGRTGSGPQQAVQATQALQTAAKSQEGVKGVAGDVDMIELCSDVEEEQDEEAAAAMQVVVGGAGDAAAIAGTAGACDGGAVMATGAGCEVRGVLRPRDNGSGAVTPEAAAGNGAAKRPKVGGIVSAGLPGGTPMGRAANGAQRQANGSSHGTKAAAGRSISGGASAGADNSRQVDGSKGAGLGHLLAMGFSAAQAERAMFLAAGDVARAAELILGGM